MSHHHAAMPSHPQRLHHHQVHQHTPAEVELYAWLADYLKPKPRPVRKVEAVLVAPIPVADVVNEPEIKRTAADLKGLHVRELTWEQAMALQTRAAS